MVRGGSNVITLDTDWISVVEAAYDPEPDLQRWGLRLYEQCLRIVGPNERSGLHVLQHDERFRTAAVPVYAGDTAFTGSDWGDGWQRDFGVSQEAFKRIYYPPSIVTTFSELSADPEAGDVLGRFSAEFGIGDSLGVLVHPAPGTVLALHVNSPQRISLTTATRRRISWLGLHLEAAARLRLRPESLRAVLGPGGRLEYCTPGTAPKSTLEQAAARVAVAKRERRAGADALGCWRALVAGELSVVERTIGSRPHFFFFDNPPHRQALTALTEGEQDVVGAVSRGQSNKAVAYGLGISESAVSLRLGRAAEKLGLASRTDLVRLAALFVRDPAALFPNAPLSTSEQEVLELLSRGLSNREIARLRERSARTIANQIASALRKTGAPSRRALAVHVEKRRATTDPLDHHP